MEKERKGEGQEGAGRGQVRREGGREGGGWEGGQVSRQASRLPVSAPRLPVPAGSALQAGMRLCAVSRHANEAAVCWSSFTAEGLA